MALLLVFACLEPYATRQWGEETRSGYGLHAIAGGLAPINAAPTMSKDQAVSVHAQ
jgi:hypothetical protein